ncbi:patatin-like phospholipase family protein [Thioalkalivibrio sp. ALE20]|uniref:patatin-like phospholipase family protein n=1 Tax=Thioalkalivibrio sp. ALE20 TaxID=545275 RepID=UPI000362B3CA|nr:patatin-like phospholipase family protein [Thioalkalivibrio sp. ALE20]
MTSRLFIAALTIATLLAAPTLQGAEKQPERPSIGLALGSGGAGGLAHIAILQVFDDLGIEPDHISGTSIGAVIGGLYAAGLSAEEILDVFDDFGGSRIDALSGLVEADVQLTELIPLRLGRNAVLDSSEFLEFLAKHTDARTFDDLRIPLSVVATDYWSGEPVVLHEGELFTAIEASMAVPGLFEPVPQGDDRLLIDGGTSNPLPWNLLQEEHDFVIAVDVSASRKQTPNDPPGLTDLLFTTFSIMQRSQIRHMREHDPPDLFLEAGSAGIRLLDFNRVEEIVEKAQPSAERLREALETRLDPPAQTSP